MTDTTRTPLASELPLDGTFLELDKRAFAYAYRSTIECSDMDSRREALEDALLKVMDRQSAAYCMVVVSATLAGENRRCREEFNGEPPIEELA